MNPYCTLPDVFKESVFSNDEKITKGPPSLDQHLWHDRNFKFPFNESGNDYSAIARKDHIYAGLQKIKKRI